MKNKKLLQEKCIRLMEAYQKIDNTGKDILDQTVGSLADIHQIAQKLPEIKKKRNIIYDFSEKDLKKNCNNKT